MSEHGRVKAYRGDEYAWETRSGKTYKHRAPKGMTTCQRNGCNGPVEYQVVFDKAWPYWFCRVHADQWHRSVDATKVKVTPRGAGRE